MKTYIFFIIAIFISINTFAQNIYKGSKIVTAYGITYGVEYHEGMLFMLYNTADTMTQQEVLRYKDGRELKSPEEYDKIQGSTKGTYNICRAFRESFGDQLITSLRIYRQNPITLFFAVSPEGKTLEVSFIVKTYPELLALKPQVFAVLERKLKEYVTWELNDFAKGLEFIHARAVINFNDVPISTEVPEKNIDESEEITGSLQE